MPRKPRKTVVEKLALAKSNGFVPGAVLPRATERTVCAWSESRLQDVLTQWKEYLAACDLLEDTNPTDNLCKNFLHFYVATAEGRITEKVSKTSVTSFWKKAVSILRLDSEIASEVHNYIENDLDVSSKTRIRHLVSGRDIDNLLRQLWQKDAFEYSCPRARVQVALWLCLQAFSGQRGGTFSESSCYRGSNESLWYKDTRLYLEKKDDGKELLHLSVGIRFRKGKRRSARSVNVEDIPTIIFYETDDPVRNVVAYFIALALADNAFKTILTIDDIVRAKIPPEDILMVLRRYC